MSSTFTTALGPIPPDWDVKTINELAAHVGSGITPTGGSDVYTNSGVMFIRSQNVTNEGLLLQDVAFIDHKTHNRMKASEVFPGDVLLNITGASIGRCCYLPSGLGPTNVNQHVCAIRLPNASSDDAKYLSSVLTSPIGQNQIFRLNAGGNREGLNYQQLRKFLVPWPPKECRIGISRILTTVDNLIEKTESLIAKYQAIKQGMMHDLFTRGVDAHGHLRPPQTEAPDLYKQSELGWIPKEWEARRLGDFTVIVRGSSPRPKGDPRYYGGAVPRLMVEDVTRDGKFVVPTIDFLTDAGAALSRPMPAGSLTLVCSGTVGVPAFLAVGACIHDGFLGFRQIGDCCSPDYLYHQFVFLKGRMDTIATHGGIFTNLTTGIVKDFQIALPPRWEQQAISEKLSACDREIAGETTALAKHRQCKAGLMHDLLTGIVRVKTDEPDAAADVL